MKCDSCGEGIVEGSYKRIKNPDDRRRWLNFHDDCGDECFWDWCQTYHKPESMCII